MTEQRISEERFAVGEVAIFWKPNSPNHGMEVTIKSPLRRTIMVDAVTGEEIECDVYTVSQFTARGPYSHAGRTPVARPKHLRKKRPPAREDEQLTTWSKCVWQPNQVRA